MNLRKWLKEHAYRKRPLERFEKNQCKNCKKSSCSYEGIQLCILSRINHNISDLGIYVSVLMLVSILLLSIIAVLIIPKPLNIAFKAVCNIRNIQSII